MIRQRGGMPPAESAGHLSVCSADNSDHLVAVVWGLVGDKRKVLSVRAEPRLGNFGTVPTKRKERPVVAHIDESILAHHEPPVGRERPRPMSQAPDVRAGRKAPYAQPVSSGARNAAIRGDHSPIRTEGDKAHPLIRPLPKVASDLVPER